MVYKHPITNLNQFVSYFESKFQKLQSATCKFYICGNLSTDFFNIHNDKKVSQYANFLINYNATNLETKVNRIIFMTSIVHIYTNKINCRYCNIVRSFRSFSPNCRDSAE